jgi:hypothetical protein
MGKRLRDLISGPGREDFSGRKQVTQLRDVLLNALPVVKPVAQSR